MKLYDCTLAPNPRRARIFIAEKGIDIPKIEVDIMSGENMRDEFRSVNPRGLLPVLELDDGTCLDETMAICRYLEELYPEPPLFGTTALERAQVECLQRKMEFDGMIAASEVFRNNIENESFSYRSTPGMDEISAVDGLVERGHVTLKHFYRWLEHYLKNSKFIAGERFSVADITALCAVDFAKWIEVEVPGENSHTLRWYDEVSSRPSAQA
jgi:glutathione S-transferase